MRTGEEHLIGDIEDAENDRRRVMEDAFGEEGTIMGKQTAPSPVTDDELETVEALESGPKPHERIAQETAEKHAIPDADRDTFIDPELLDEDIITEDDSDKDMRVKSTRHEFSDREIRFVVNYYARKDAIRNIVIDFEDALPENLKKIGKELLSRGFIWAAEEARAYLRNMQIDLQMCDLDMIHAAFRYIEKEQPQQVRLMIDRFSESKNLNNTRVLSEETIDNLETLLYLYENQTQHQSN
jgi:hypothetical protein